METREMLDEIWRFSENIEGFNKYFLQIAAEDQIQLTGIAIQYGFDEVRDRALSMLDPSLQRKLYICIAELTDRSLGYLENLFTFAQNQPNFKSLFDLDSLHLVISRFPNKSDSESYSRLCAFVRKTKPEFLSEIFKITNQSSDPDMLEIAKWYEV